MQASRKALSGKPFIPIAEAALVLAVGLAITLALWHKATTHLAAQTEERFRAHTDFVQKGVLERLNDYQNLLLAAQGLFLASDEVNRGEFHRYYENVRLRERLPGFHAFSFTRLVPQARKAAFIAGVRRDTRLNPAGNPGFDIRPPGERAEYWVIDFIEPFDETRAAFGLDAGTQPANQEGFPRARDDGGITLTAPFQLVETPRGQSHLILRAPVYRNGAPIDTVGRRRAAFVGFVGIAMKSDGLFSDFLNAEFLEGLRVVIRDEGLAESGQKTAGSPVLDTTPEGVAAGNGSSALSKSSLLRIADRNWRIDFIAGESWLAKTPDRDIHRFFLFGGSAISLLLAALYYTLARSQSRAVELAERTTSDLRRSEERFRAASEASSEWYWEQDRDHRFVDFVGKAHEIAGLDFSSVRGRTRWEVNPAALSPEDWAAHREMLEARRPFTITYKARIGAGRELWLESKGLPRFGENGEFLGYHGTGRDITAQVNSENRLREQAVLLQTILEHMGQGISVVDRELRLVGWNRRFIEMLDFPDELARPGTPFEDFVRYNAQRGEYGPGEVEEQVRARIALARRFEPHYIRRRRPNGVTLEIVGNPLPGGGFVTTYTDVSEQERFAERIRRERDFRQRLIESIPGVFYLFDRDGRFLQWNRNLESVTGYSAEEMQRAHPLDFFEGEDRRLIQESIGRVFETGHAAAEALFLAKDGHGTPYYFTGERIELEDGRPGLIGVGFDISERKHAGEALAAQTAILQATLEAMDQGVSVVDKDLRMKALNRRFCELLEFPEAMARSGASFADFARFNAQRGEYGPGDVEEKVREMVERARHPVPHHFKRSRPNGRIIDVKGFPMAEGGFVTIYSDITEQEQARTALLQSEQRYRTLIDLSPDAVFVHRNHRILMGNPAAARLWGLNSAEEAVGRDVLDFIHPDWRELVRARIAQIESAPVQSRLPWTEQEYLCGDGSIIPVEGSATAIALEDGPAVLSVIRDISARKEAENALRSERDFSRKLVESIPGIFYLFDTRGHFLLWNRNLEVILGKTAEEIRQSRTIGLFDEADRDAIRRATRQTIEAGSANLEAKLVAKDGSRIPYYISGLRLEADGREVVIGLGFDISERKRAEQLIREVNEMLEKRVRERTAELEASNRELESFSYSVSHDLRSPLRALDGFSHIIEEEYGERLDEEGRSYLRRIRSASRRMGKLIDDLLDLARIGRQELKPVEVDLSRLAGEVRDALLEQDATRRVAWDIAPGLVARADPLLMKVALDNLLRNAWKFTAEKTEARIEFGRCATEGGAAFFVRDNGAGFEMEYMDKLFKPFQRLHDIKRFEGTGIGLAIVQRIVRRHHGRVWAESRPNEGAAFYFTLGTE